MTATSAEYFLYGDKPVQVRPAGGTKGVLIRTLDGTIMLRVYETGEVFTDYEIRHDDLAVTIDPDAMAALYKVEERDVLDHSPEVLGLKKVSGS